MKHSKTSGLRRQVIQFRHQFGQVGHSLMSRMLDAQRLEQIVCEEVRAHRHRLYPALTTLRLFLGQALSDDHACQDVVGRRLSERVARNEPASSLNTGPYCKARQRLPLSLPVRLMRMLGQAMEQQACLHWAWRGRAVKLFDATTLSMPDTPSLRCVYPQSPEQRPGLGFPLARIGGLFGLASGGVLDYAVAAMQGKGSGEQTLLRQLLPALRAGDILLADALHATWWTLALLQRQGVDAVMPQHGRRRTDFSQGIVLGRRDHLVEWPRPKLRPSWLDEAQYRALPAALLVREAEVEGRVLVSTLTDARGVRPADLDALYRMRWNIEVDFRTLKVGMDLDVLRCKSPKMVNKEIAVGLLAYNLVRSAMVNAASLAHLAPRLLSFAGARRVLSAFADQLRHAPNRRLTRLLAIVLGVISTLALPHRPDRIEPRAKKRRPKPLPLLTVPRHIARAQILASRMLKVVP